jgi:hypothetical protein
MIDYLVLLFAVLAALTGIIRCLQNERLWRHMRKRTKPRS